MCAVSYTSLPKRSRRSLDTLLVFSCPMKGDMQILTWEYCQNQSMARFAMNSLKDYQCLVLETLEKRQSLFVWRADLLGVASNTENGSSQERGYLEPYLLPRLPRNIHVLAVKQVAFRSQIISYLRNIQVMLPFLQMKQVSRDVSEKMLFEVSDQLWFAPDGRVPDSWCEQPFLIENAEQIHQVRL